MKNKSNLLEQSFDWLSSFPYFSLRKALTLLWIISTVVAASRYLIDLIAIFHTHEIKPGWIKSLIIWSVINPLFGRLYHLWWKREKERGTKESVSAADLKKEPSFAETIVIFLRRTNIRARFVTFGMMPVFFGLFLFIGKLYGCGESLQTLKPFGVAGILIGSFIGHQLYYRWIFPEKGKAS